MKTWAGTSALLARLCRHRASFGPVSVGRHLGTKSGSALILIRRYKESIDEPGPDARDGAALDRDRLSRRSDLPVASTARTLATQSGRCTQPTQQRRKQLAVALR